MDGLIILRFAHAFENGAGLEYDIAVINRALGERNAVTTIWVHRARQSETLDVKVEKCGLGTLVKIPIFREMILSAGHASSAVSKVGECLRSLCRDHILFNPLFYRFLFKRSIEKWRPPTRSEDIIGAGKRVYDLLKKYKVDLIVLHSLGGSDAEEILDEAQRARIPVVLQLHFANDRYRHLSIRRQTVRASGITGVSGLRVPRYLWGRFVNLMTGLDTNLFARVKAKPLTVHFENPVLMLPARIVPSKGHTDLIRAVAMLRDTRLNFDVVFAGRSDDCFFEEELKKRVTGLGLSSRFHFPGLLNQEELRDWYAAAALVAFPTYHHEGLPRVILEAQAMKVPVVAYATGGVPEGMITGRTGYLLKTGDIKGLAAKLGELLGNPELCQRMGEEGRRFVEERYNLEALARRHEDFYLKVLSGYQQARGCLGGEPSTPVQRTPFTTRGAA